MKTGSTISPARTDPTSVNGARVLFYEQRKREMRRKILVGARCWPRVEHEGVPTLRSRVDLLRWFEARLTSSRGPQDATGG